MESTGTGNSWSKIQQSVKDTENLINQKQYNLAMVKARQTLEHMVRSLGEQALIIDGDLSDNIDQLYESHWINKETKDHYHRIRVLGNKAVHDDNNSSYDAEEAYKLLLHELSVFSDNRNKKAPYKPVSQGPSAIRTTSRTSVPTRSTASQGQKTSSARNTEILKNSNAYRSRKRHKRKGFDPYDLLRPAAILVIIILLAALIKILIPGKKDQNKVTTTASTTISEETMAPVTQPATTEASTEAVIIYKTTTNVNVRKQPSTDSERLGTLTAGTTVEYVKEHDNTWAVIRYNGQEAYVSRQYLLKQADTATAPSSEESSGTP